MTVPSTFVKNIREKVNPALLRSDSWCQNTRIVDVITYSAMNALDTITNIPLKAKDSGLSPSRRDS